MFNLIINPLSSYQRLISEEPWRWVLYFLVANIAILAMASTLVGMIIYGKLFAFSLILWAAIWLILVLLGWYIKSLIGNYLLKIAGKKANLVETLLSYGLAYGTNILVIVIYLILDLLMEFLIGVRFIISLVVIVGFLRYIQMAAYGLRQKYSLPYRFSLIVVLISLIPEILLYLFLY